MIIFLDGLPVGHFGAHGEIKDNTKMRPAKRTIYIKPPATLEINAEAARMREEGRSVISLAVGEPDFPTPAYICEAAKKAIDNGVTRYTPVPGFSALRQAVAEYTRLESGVSVTIESIQISNGAKQAICNILLSFIDPGDEVIIAAPYWVSYPEMIRLAGAVPVVVSGKIENSFRVGPEELEKARTLKTKMFIFNSPANPTGTVYTAEEISALAEWAKQTGIFIISDEVYSSLVYSPAKHASFMNHWQTNPENIAVVGALSKTYAMTGWRVGYTIAEQEAIWVMNKIQGQTTSNVCSISQMAALAALQGATDGTGNSERAIQKMLTAYERRRNLALAEMSDWPGVIVSKPDGAFYIFADFSSHYTKTIPDSLSLGRKILNDAEVAVVPGLPFGDDRCLRISYSVNDEDLLTALQKIRKTITSI